MKKFAAGLLTAFCATAIATAQDFDQSTEWTDAQPQIQQNESVQQTTPVQNTIAATNSNVTNVTNVTNVHNSNNSETMPIDEQPVVTPKKKAPIGFGAKASFIYGYFWGFKDLDDLDEPSGIGGEFGVAARFTITDGLLFTPEIAFRIFNLDHGDDDVTRNFDQTFLDFAFYIRGVVSNALYLEVGPQISINTSADYDIESQNDSYSHFENIEQAPVEFGLNIGAGYYVLDNLSVGVRWYMGFNELFPDVKYLDELGKDDYDGQNVKKSVKCSFSNLKGAHTMMFKFGVTYWFN